MLSLNRLALFSMICTLAATAGAQSADVSPTPGTAVNGPTYFSAPTDAPFVYTNGPYVTGTGNGFGGANTSAIESGFNTFGYGCQATIPIRVADDFVVPSGQTWTLSKLHWLSYQTGASTAGTINGISVNIWNTTPSVSGTPIWSSAANVYMSHAWTGVYRVVTTALTGNTRAIMDVQANLAGAPALGPGTYWIDVGLTGTLASGPWAPPTVPRLSTDNGMQFQVSTGWIPTSDTTALVPQDFPFALEGDDGVGGCGVVTNYCTGKVNSNACTPSIAFVGPDPVQFAAAGSTTANFTVSNISPRPGATSHLGQLFYGTSGAAGAPFLGGTLCVKGLLRVPPLVNTGGTVGSTTLCDSSVTQNFNARIASGSDANLTAGATVWMQGWARDTAAFQGVQLSNACTFTICP